MQQKCMLAGTPVTVQDVRIRNSRFETGILITGLPYGDLLYGGWSLTEDITDADLKWITDWTPSLPFRKMPDGVYEVTEGSIKKDRRPA